jgi:hypothetical protein
VSEAAPKAKGRPWTWKWTLGLVVAVAAMLQLYPVPRSNPSVVSDLVAPAAIKTVLVRSCYDCHSHQTRWPWYSRVAPVSWWMVSHVTRARKDLNFSTWPTFDPAAQDQTLREIAAQVKRGSMPLPSYLWGHPDARLSAADKQLILDWAGATGEPFPPWGADD